MNLENNKEQEGFDIVIDGSKCKSNAHLRDPTLEYKEKPMDGIMTGNS